MLLFLDVFLIKCCLGENKRQPGKNEVVSQKEKSSNTSFADNTTYYNGMDLVLLHHDAPLASSGDTLSACKILFCFQL